MMRSLVVVFVFIALSQFTISAPLVDDVVPEEALMAKQDTLHIIDDPMDEKQNQRTDYNGRNSITGQIVTKGSDGTTDGHIVGGYVKNPGYVASDSWTSPGGPSEGGGAYYLGSGRRRIGAGFGRRRRAVELPMSKAEQAAAKKKWGDILKDPSKLKSILHFAHQRTSHYAEDAKKDTATITKNLKGKAKSLMAGLSRKQFDQLTREWFGIENGPSFYSEVNYKGIKYITRKSVKDLDAVGKLNGNDLSALKVPAGWKVELYTEKDFAGESLKVDGPAKIWSLGTKALTLHSSSIEHVNKGLRSSFHTTWNNQVMSIKITKYDFDVVLVKKKCPTTCGINKFEYTGKVTCTRSGGLKKKATVKDADCTEVHLTKPKVPKKRCAATAKCAEFKTSKPTAPCTTTCGFPGDVKKGKVWCQFRPRNAKDGKLPKEASATSVKVATTTDKSCDTWGLKKPATPTKKCPKTSRCVKWVVSWPKSCPIGCGHSASKVHSKAQCTAVAGGAKAKASECAHWKKPQPATKTKSCSGTAPCPTSAPTRAPTPRPVKKKCKVSSINGFSDYAWDPRGRYCYKIKFGSWVQQDWAHSKARCNAGQFHSNVYIGRYNGNAHFYPNGDSKSCPGGKKRTVSVEVRQDPGVRATTAKVTEPQTCAYKMVITRKSCP